jgi:hypothetical protein
MKNTAATRGLVIGNIHLHYSYEPPVWLASKTGAAFLLGINARDF